ncbi:RtcB family protein [Candidatus Parcubacteria bacterium]|nr:RtcB family protein [Patescibacteria group bacterium]MBU4347200.1 RtcB family protein [Patescibacteria group bacterium]MCG2691013.1 RtcB family protein [Candidatus Parcubacteria bacterium]
MKIIKEEKIPIKMWLDEIEPDTMRQVRNIANLPGAFHHIAIMPDAHIGYGMPIGGVLATVDTIVPNAVGVDIGCGMAAVKTTIQEIDEYNLKQILNKLRRIIPTGFTHHKEAQKWEGFDRAPDIPIIRQELNSARKQIGTLGGGNHFVEILREAGDKKWNIAGQGNIWLMLHSGSRNFGLKAANVYHRKARRFCELNNIDLPDRDLSFLKLDSPEGGEYWQAMNYCLEFAKANRHLMMERFMDIFQAVSGCEFIDFNKEHAGRSGHSVSSWTPSVLVAIHHNYAAREEHFGKTVIIHRKGATRAFKGQLGIVPGSMGTPSYIVEGLGNPESFMSCAHGAGRVLGRREASRVLTREQADEAVKGIIFEGWRGKFDEAPQAYKNIETVIKNQIDLARPIVKLKPLAVMIGG